MNPRGARFRKAAYAGVRWGSPSFVAHVPALFGLLWALALPDLRRRVRGNLRRLRGIRPPLQEELDVLRTFVEYAHCFAESLGGERPEALAAEPTVVGGERLDAILRAGKGAVLVTAHTGAWDAAARCLARDYAADVVIVMAAEDDAEARRVSDAVRERSGVRVVHVGKNALDALPLLGHLRRGGVVAVQLDRAAPDSAFVVPFGQGDFLVPQGPFRLAQLSGTPILPVFTRRLGYFDYEITVCPAIRVPRNASEEDLVTVARAAARCLEDYVSKNPTQWFHFSG